MANSGQGEVSLTKSFDEVQVFDGVAQRTGNVVPRNSVRGHAGVCRSMSELHAKSRRLGDGFYYVATSAWPEGEVSVNLTLTWNTMS